MKLKNKGKVYPSPSSSPSSNSRPGADDFISVLNILPATILTLASVLSLQDREVLAYMITRSLKTTTTAATSATAQDSKKKLPKSSPSLPSGGAAHKSPLFDCDCFECYTSYWFRWDSSVNRELIHQVIEAFEEHLTNGELLKKNGKNKRRDKTGRRVSDKPVIDVLTRPDIREPAEVTVKSVIAPSDDVFPADGAEVKGNEETAAQLVVEVSEELTVVVKSPPADGVNHHKGLARKVLPDVLGLFNSRLWHLWNPNV
ncbi:uncharacterized protein LOC126655249 [Mercurialis annua]|uniref:uncharacterized protein LOC126655249 n=1 Tax=Mercurialis annua TaxID=3986 RepID=UPI002160879F|nr:uncharacterized protein LOC126655249 [Mercurialis annua]